MGKVLHDNAEVFLPIPKYEGLYAVSNYGRVKSLCRKKERVLKPCVRNGYAYVVLCRNGEMSRHSIHRLVATVFVPNTEGKLEVNHIDGKRLNNNAINLEWVSRSENQKHAFRTGLQPIIYNNPARVKAVDMLSSDGELVKTFPSAAEAERQTGINSAHISKCCCGKRKTAGGYPWRFHIGGRK